MIKRLGAEKIEGLNLVPVAAIDVSTERFTSLGIEFDHDIDDLDSYAVAAFSISGKGVFAFMHYDTAKRDEVTLLVEDKESDEVAFTAVIECVSRHFNVPVSLFHWKSNGYVVRLADRSEEVHVRA